ncbi:MAG: hypothetical protein IKV25_07005 [Clostridia bacterium]|nr:hypothetical protein [Clostridia bacterium]
MTILEDLYYGNIVPADKSFKRGSEYSKLLNLAARNEEKLSATLTKEQKILFEKYKECCMDMYGIAELEAFVSGMKLGVKIIVETYTGCSENFKKI